MGREGAGNAEAARAWKALVGLGLDALFPTLKAMKDDDLTSANWLRPAVDAIAEKAAAAGKALPKADRKVFLILSLLTSDWELKHMPESGTGTASVDWVRVWQDTRLADQNL